MPFLKRETVDIEAWKRAEEARILAGVSEAERKRRTKEPFTLYRAPSGRVYASAPLAAGDHRRPVSKKEVV